MSVPPNKDEASVPSVPSVNMLEEKETAAFFRSLDLILTSSGLLKPQEEMESPMPSSSPIPFHEDVDLAVCSPDIPNVPDDTAMLPVPEPNIPLYIEQQQQLVTKELTVKIIRLTETELHAHQKPIKVMTTPK